jgi:hypothetical protein
MDQPDPLIELVKILARRQARLDAIAPRPTNQNENEEMPARKQ